MTRNVNATLVGQGFESLGGPQKVKFENNFFLD